MPKNSVPTEIAGYTILPLVLPPVPGSFPDPATHYLYLRPHEPRIPSADAARSLFLVNVPIDATELHFRHLFSSQLAAGRVERVQFDRTDAAPTSIDTETQTQSQTQAQSQTQGKKRKRQEVAAASAPSAASLQSQLSQLSLPSTWDRKMHASGSHAVVTFVDRPAMEASLKAARKAASRGKSSKATITWGEGIEARVNNSNNNGIHRYRKHSSKLRYPPANELLEAVNEYMALFATMEEAREREAAQRAQEPDEDGFVTVTRGPRFTDVAREEEVRELVAKQRKREEGLGDFYRFQNREKRKERQNELLRRFEEDKRKIEKLKRGRGGIRPEGM